MTNFSIPVSAGEIIDKYSILVIKKHCIKDNEQKQNDILHELTCLLPVVSNLLEDDFTYIQYQLLVYVNKVIWDFNDKVREVYQQSIGARIMTENDARFRCKSRINDFSNSEIKEHKNSKATTCTIVCDNTVDEQCLQSLNEFVLYHTLYYNIVYVSTKITLVPSPICRFSYVKFVNNTDELHDGDKIKFSKDTSLPSEFTDVMRNHYLN